MSENAGPKKIRSNVMQRKRLIELMDNNRKLAKDKLDGQVASELWDDVTKELNEIPDGSFRDKSAWIKSWTDLVKGARDRKAAVQAGSRKALGPHDNLVLKVMDGPETNDRRSRSPHRPPRQSPQRSRNSPHRNSSERPRNSPHRSYANSPKHTQKSAPRTYRNSPQRTQNSPHRTYRNSPQRTHNSPHRSYANSPQRTQNSPHRTYRKSPQRTQNSPHRAYRNSPQRTHNSPHRSYANSPQRTSNSPHRTYRNSPQRTRNSPQRSYADSGRPSPTRLASGSKTLPSSSESVPLVDLTATTGPSRLHTLAPATTAGKGPSAGVSAIIKEMDRYSDKINDFKEQVVECIDTQNGILKTGLARISDVISDAVQKMFAHLKQENKESHEAMAINERDNRAVKSPKDHETDNEEDWPAEFLDSNLFTDE